jgi:hypothetical protein
VSSIALHHSLLRTLPEPSSKKLLADLKLIEVALGPLLWEVSRRDVVYLPLDAVFANETIDVDGNSAFQAFSTGTHIFGLQRHLVPHVSQRLSVVGKGYALRGERERIHQLLVEIGVESLFKSATLQGMVEINSGNSICATSHAATARIARLLIEANHVFREKNAITLNQSILGRFVGTRRETVAEVLGALRREKIITMGRQKLNVIDMPALEARACACWRYNLRATDRYHYMLAAGQKTPYAPVYVLASSSTEPLLHLSNSSVLF